MAEHIQQDRGTMPALDALMRQTADAQLSDLAEALAGGMGTRGRRAERRRALVRLSLDFWTWRRPDREGLDDAGAADLITGVFAATA